MFLNGPLINDEDLVIFWMIVWFCCNYRKNRGISRIGLPGHIRRHRGMWVKLALRKIQVCRFMFLVRFKSITLFEVWWLNLFWDQFFKNLPEVDLLNIPWIIDICCLHTDSSTLSDNKSHVTENDLEPPTEDPEVKQKKNEAKPVQRKSPDQQTANQIQDGDEVNITDKLLKSRRNMTYIPRLLRFAYFWYEWMI